MTLQDVVDRLNAQCPLLGNRAALLVDINEIENLDTDIPAAFVLRTSDEAAENEGMGALTTQALTRTFTVLVMAGTPTDTGEPAEDVRAEVWQALLQWTPSPDVLIEYAGGDAQAPVSGIARWQDRFIYTEYLRYQRP